MKVTIFGTFGLKTPTHAPELGFLVDFTSKWVQCQRYPRSHTFA